MFPWNSFNLLNQKMRLAMVNHHLFQLYKTMVSLSLIHSGLLCVPISVASFLAYCVYFDISCTLCGLLILIIESLMTFHTSFIVTSYQCCFNQCRYLAIRQSESMSMILEDDVLDVPNQVISPQADTMCALGQPGHQELGHEDDNLLISKLFPNSIKVSGVKHICDNLLGSVLNSLPQLPCLHIFS